MNNYHFYFVSDSYFQEFPDRNLMQNKEIINGVRHDRPCFYAFPDTKFEGLLWCVPISSKVDKYQEIFRKKKEKYGNCNTIRFGEVMGQKRAFLIQNMFPMTEDYIADIYVDRNTKKEVTIDPETSRDIQTNARAVLKLYQRGIPVIFPNVKVIQDVLIAKLRLEKEYDPQASLHNDNSEVKNLPLADCCHWNKVLAQQVQLLDIHKKDVFHKETDVER